MAGSAARPCQPCLDEQPCAALPAHSGPRNFISMPESRAQTQPAMNEHQRRTSAPAWLGCMGQCPWQALLPGLCATPPWQEAKLLLDVRILPLAHKRFLLSCSEGTPGVCLVPTGYVCNPRVYSLLPPFCCHPLVPSPHNQCTCVPSPLLVASMLCFLFRSRAAPAALPCCV